MSTFAPLTQRDWSELRKKLLDESYTPELTEEGASFMDALHEMKGWHGVDTNVALLLVGAAGGHEEALALLDEGVPVEFILAMGEKE